MKKFLMMFVSLILITWCINTQPSHNAPQKSEKITEIDFSNEKDVIQHETFNNEYYINFDEVKNIAHSLNVPLENVKTLKESDQRLIFCFEKSVSEDMTCDDYRRMMIEDGYEWTHLDGTISSTTLLKKDQYEVTVTETSDISAWKNG